MERKNAPCTVCGRQFAPQFRFQIRKDGEHTVYLCSQTCQQHHLEEEGACRCSVCGEGFTLEYPFQLAMVAGTQHHFCSTKCRSRFGQRPNRRTWKGPRRIAVFNHKGGTGKTTTSINLAAGLAETGLRVLLIDADGQGNVGASLGIHGEHNLYHVLVTGASVEDTAVPVRNNLDVLTSNELIAAAELYLAGRPNRDRVMRERIGRRTDDYDVVVLDCAPTLSLMNQNALMYAESVVVPVSCDYLSLVGVRQVLRTLKNVRELLSHDLKLFGVLPTFHDVRNRISREALASLQEHFGRRCLPPVRINTKLREAPSGRQTIFEYAPHSNGARDYMTLVQRIRELDPEYRAEAHERDAAEVRSPHRGAQREWYSPAAPMTAGAERGASTPAMASERTACGTVSSKSGGTP